MRNYKLVLAYDGSKYKGWQRQALTGQTIQEILECEVGQIVGYPVHIDGSGRTDAGVHASGQVANVKVAGLLKENFQEELNKRLPEDIRILNVILVPGSFHSRYDAVAKRYRYCIDTREKPCVFSRRFTCHYPKVLNLEEMDKAAGYLIGTHDFSAFTDDKKEKSKVRTIYNIEMKQSGTNIQLEFYGTGFLYHMVRILTGTLLEVGSGQKKAEDIPVILKKKDRSYAGFLAPARGLILEKVYYEEEER